MRKKKTRIFSVLVCLIISFACCACNVIGNSKEWQQAERKWELFKQQYKDKTGQYKITFQEVKFPLIKKFFPSCRIFRDNQGKTFALNKDGIIIKDISNGWSCKDVDSIEEAKLKFENPAYSNFVTSQNVRIDNASDATGFLRLTAAITGRPSYYNYPSYKKDNSWIAIEKYQYNRFLLFLERFLPFIKRGSSSRLPDRWGIEVDKENRVSKIYFLSLT